MSSVANFFVGVDLHRTLIQICVLNEAGETVHEKRFRTSDFASGLEVVEFLARWRLGGRFAVEAIGLNRWFVNACQTKGLDVIVADPVKLNLKMLGRKTDRADAHEIARRLFLGDIDRCAATYYPSEDEYGARKVLRARHQLLSTRQQLVNQLRAIFNAYRVPVPRGVLYSPKNLAWLQQCTLTVEDLTATVRILAEVLSAVQIAIGKHDLRIRERSHREGCLLQLLALPSVGAQTAVTLMYELGDVRRFKNARAVASYAGLVPWVSNSADVSHHGRLTKRGNRELRWILSEWAVRLMSHHALARAWAAPKLRRMHKNKVRIALARRLLVGVYIMLCREESFTLEKCLAS